MMKITGLSHLFKWENLHNWWLTKYFFAPLYVVVLACALVLCFSAEMCLKYLYYIYIYIYAFSRRFYPKRLTIAFRLYIFISMCVPWESNPQPFALLTQCSTTEPHRNTVLNLNLLFFRNLLPISHVCIEDGEKPMVMLPYMNWGNLKLFLRQCKLAEANNPQVRLPQNVFFIKKKYIMA